MQCLFSYLPASQTITSSLLPGISSSSTEPASFRPSVSSLSNNIPVGSTLTPSRDLSVTTRASAITELSSQGALLASSFSSFETQNASLLISESITSPVLVCSGFCSEASQGVNQRKPLLFFLSQCNNLDLLYR